MVIDANAASMNGYHEGKSILTCAQPVRVHIGISLKRAKANELAWIE